MDPVPLSQPSSLPNQLLASAKGKVVVLTVAIITIGALFYFLYYRPQLTVLDSQMTEPVASSEVSEKIYPTPNKFQAGPFRCPSVASFCESGQDVILADSYVGFGGKVEADSPIYAAFDGDISASLPPNAEEESKKYGITIWWSVLLTNKENAMKALYTFPGKVSKQGAVKRGEVIGQASGKLMPTFGDYSLIFRLFRFDDKMGNILNGEVVKLKTTDFNQN